MKLLVFTSLLLLVTLCSSLTPLENEELEKTFGEGSKVYPLDENEALEEYTPELNEESLEANEEERKGKKCTARNHDCSHNRHSCCKSTLFTDDCICFFKAGRAEEVCTCQQQWHYAKMEKGYKKIKGCERKKKCVEEHHECTKRQNSCCKGEYFDLKCECYKVVSKAGQKSKRCACITAPLHKIAGWFANLGKNIAG